MAAKVVLAIGKSRVVLLRDDGAGRGGPRYLTVPAQPGLNQPLPPPGALP